MSKSKELLLNHSIWAIVTNTNLPETDRVAAVIDRLIDVMNTWFETWTRPRGGGLLSNSYYEEQSDGVVQRASLHFDIPYINGLMECGAHIAFDWKMLNGTTFSIYFCAEEDPSEHATRTWKFDFIDFGRKMDGKYNYGVRFSKDDLTIPSHYTFDYDVNPSLTRIGIEEFEHFSDLKLSPVNYLNPLQPFFQSERDEIMFIERISSIP